MTQDKDIVQEVSMLKALTGELVNEVLQTCQQFHGGMGYIRETAIERLWRDSRILGIGGGATEVMLDEVVEQSRGFFRANQEWFRRELREASPWFVPDFVDRKIFASIVEKTEDTFSRALSDKNHELRKRLHGSILIFVEKLETSDDFQKKGEALKGVLLSSDIFRGYISSLRDAFLQSVKADAQSDTSLLAATIDRILQNFVATTKASPALQHRLDNFMRSILRSAFGEQSTHVADLIARTIEGWDTKTLVSKLEEQVGNDLQYIRINGTLVGGLVGLFLYYIEKLF